MKYSLDKMSALEFHYAVSARCKLFKGGSLGLVIMEIFACTFISNMDHIEVETNVGHYGNN